MSYFVVVCNSASNSLGLYDLDDNGRLNHREDMALPVTGAPATGYPMALSPDRQKLHVAFRGEPREILTFAIDRAERRLRLLGRAPLADSMAHIAVDSRGRHLFSASYSGGKVSVNPIGAQGVALAPSDTLALAGKMHCCIPLPGTDTFFATSLATDTIYRLSVDANGRLLRQPEEARTQAGHGARHLVLHPDGRFAYLVTELTATIGVFGLEDGRLTAEPLQTLSILPPRWQGGDWGADIRITPDGRFVYASDRKANCITGFSVGADGLLSRIGETYTAPWPRAINITPDGRFLLALGENSDQIEVFAIDAAGALDKRHAVTSGHAPSWVEVLVD
jgi:6-phosphogluconolactonase